MKSPVTLLAAIVVLGVVLRCWQAGESLWIDELHTSWTVSGSFAQVAERAALGNQSPLYFWFVWFFARLPLPSELALRLPSLLAGCGLPVAIYWLAQQFRQSYEKSFSAAGSLLAVTLVAIDPLAIFYAQEARPYAWLQLVVVIHIGLLLRILERSTWPARVGWVITGALLVHLHYTGGLILIAESAALVGLLFHSPCSSQDQPTCEAKATGVQMCFACWLDLGALAILLLPAIPGMLAVAARRDQWRDMAAMPQLSELATLFPCMSTIVVFWLPKVRPVLTRNALVILSCWGLIPLVLAWILSRSGVAALFFPRYLVAAWPASMIAFGLIPEVVRPRSRIIFVLVILAWGFYSGELIHNIVQLGRPMTSRKEDWRTAIALLNAELKQQPDPVLVGSGLLEADELPDRGDPLFREYCLLPVRGVYRLETAEVYPLRRTDPGQLDSATVERLASADGVWLLIRGDVESHAQIVHDLSESRSGSKWSVAKSPRVFGHVYWLRLERAETSIANGL